jgi:hypothetical protein
MREGKRKKRYGYSPKHTQISTDVALRDIVNKRSYGSGFEAGIGLMLRAAFTVAGAVSGLHRLFQY